MIIFIILCSLVGVFVLILDAVRYQEADVIPCCSEEPSEEKARQALRDAVLRSDNSQTVTNLSRCTRVNSLY